MCIIPLTCKTVLLNQCKNLIAFGCFICDILVISLWLLSPEKSAFIIHLYVYVFNKKKSNYSQTVLFIIHSKRDVFLCVI